MLHESYRESGTQVTLRMLQKAETHPHNGCLEVILNGIELYAECFINSRLKKKSLSHCVEHKKSIHLSTGAFNISLSVG
jgi:hypothetical protein